MKTLTHLYFLILIPILLSGANLLAQDKENRSGRLTIDDLKKNPKTTGSENAQSEIRFDIKFEGGSVLDFLAATKDLPINVIVPEEADEVKLPEFKVTSVTDVELFSALNVLLPNDNKTRIQFEAGGRSSQKNRVWALSIKPQWIHPNAKLEETNKVITHPVSIGPLLEEFSIDAVTTAIAQSVEIFQKSHTQIKGEEVKPVNIAFHPETKLLILSGPEKSMAVAGDTLKALFDGIKQVRKTPPPKEDN